MVQEAVADKLGELRRELRCTQSTKYKLRIITIIYILLSVRVLPYLDRTLRSTSKNGLAFTISMGV